MLTDRIKDHMAHPRNRGEMERPDGVGEVVGPVCGDAVTVYVKVSGGQVRDVKFTTYGCWAAIAIGSLISEMAVGQSLEAALRIDGRWLALEVAGLPEDKIPCSELVAAALHKAVCACLICGASTEPG
jgi:nitrogen fixation protein NifU and related proteins